MSPKKSDAKSGTFNASAHDPAQMAKDFTTFFKMVGDGPGSEFQKAQITGSLFHEVGEHLEKLLQSQPGEVKSGDAQKTFGPLLDLLTSGEVAPYLPANAPQMLVALGVVADQRAAALDKIAFESPSVPHSFVSHLVEMFAIGEALRGYAMKVQAQKKDAPAPKAKQLTY